MADLLMLQREIYQNAVDHGFWDDAENNNVPTKLMLIVSELAEALEEFRHDRMDLYYAETGEPPYAGAEEEEHSTTWDAAQAGKPEGFGVELADALIRILDLSARLGLDMGALVELKMAYNKTRPHKHGGRRV